MLEYRAVFVEGYLQCSSWNLTFLLSVVLMMKRMGVWIIVVGSVEVHASVVDLEFCLSVLGKLLYSSRIFLALARRSIIRVCFISRQKAAVADNANEQSGYR